MRKGPPKIGDQESDIDGTTNRVASVTLESDSLSEAPMSLRHKRRRRLPKRERMLPVVGTQRMEVDVDVDAESMGGRRRAQQHNMDWKESTSGATADTTDLSSSSSDTNSRDSIGYGADGEQSDWPGALEDGPIVGNSRAAHPHHHPHHSPHPHHLPMDISMLTTPNFQVPRIPPSLLLSNNHPTTVPKDNHCLTSTVVKRIERFLADTQQRELILSHVYHASAVKRALKANAPVQLLKRGRSTVILKKTG